MVSLPDFSDQVQRSDLKIKPRKGRPAQRAHSPLPNMEDDLKDILSTRWIAQEPVMKDVSSSPPLKSLPHRLLSSLTHEPDCPFPCCSEPCLARATARWAATQADLVLHLDPCDLIVSSTLHRATLLRCRRVTMRLEEKLAKLFPPCNPGRELSKPSLMQDVVGRVYLSMAMTGLQTKPNKLCSIWKILEVGLAFVDSTTSPVLRPVKAGLMATKAIASLIILAAKKDCRPEELYSNVWTWIAPKEYKDTKSEQESVPPSSLHKKTKESTKISDIPVSKKETKKVKPVVPKIQVICAPTKEKGLVVMTPVMTKSKSSHGELGVFNFNTLVPTLAFTPVQKLKCPASAQKASRTASKLQFHVYEEVSSPNGDKTQTVPAAPRRTKKSRFKVSRLSKEKFSQEHCQKLRGLHTVLIFTTGGIQ